jgi:hypothetical protein
MVTLKNEMLFNNSFGESLLKLSKCIFKDDIQTTIQIAKTIKAIQEEANVVFSIRDTLLEEYGVTVNNGKISIQDNTKLKEFNTKLNELAKEKFEVPLKNKIVVTNDMSQSLDANDLVLLSDILIYD